MSRYRAIFDGNGLVAEIEDGETVYLRPGYGENDRKSDLPAPMVLSDIGPYRNMIDGKVISSRSAHRELLKRHGCEEVGNSPMKSVPAKPKSTRRELIARQLGDVSDREANKVLKSLRKQVHP